MSLPRQWANINFQVSSKICCLESELLLTPVIDEKRMLLLGLEDNRKVVSVVCRLALLAEGTHPSLTFTHPASWKHLQKENGLFTIDQTRTVGAFQYSVVVTNGKITSQNNFLKCLDRMSITNKDPYLWRQLQ